MSERELRTRARDSAIKSRLYFRELMQDEDDFDSTASGMDDELDRDLSDDFSDESGSDYSDESYSTVPSGANTPRKVRIYHPRPKSPIFTEEREIPPLVLPTSSTDLIIPSEHLMSVLSIYETLRHFRVILRISPFR